MPRIPQYQRQDLPGAAFNPPPSGQRIGAAIANLGEALFDINESVRQADRVYKAQQIEQGLSDDFDDAMTTFSTRTDYDKFDPDVDSMLPTIKSKYDKIAGSDPKLQQALNFSFDHSARQFKRVLAAKKTQLITDGSKAQLDMSIERSLNGYAAAETPDERDAIRNKIEIEAQMMADAKIITQQDVVNKMQAFDKASESLRADRLVLDDPELAKKELASGQFNLDPTVTQSKIEKADKRLLALDRDNDRKIAKAERDSRRIAKEIRDTNSSIMFQKFYKGELNEETLDRMVVNRQITGGAYRTLKAKINSDVTKEINDPIVVAEISSAISSGDYENAKKSLDVAIKNGNIKTETYISMNTKLSSKEYGSGLSYIKGAMEPTIFETDFYKKQKYVDAVSDYTARTADGVNPKQAASEVVDLYKEQKTSDLSRFRRPMFMEGDTKDFNSMALAMDKTADAFKKGRILIETYKNEMRLITDINNALAESNRLNDAMSVDEEMKKRKVGK